MVQVEARRSKSINGGDYAGSMLGGLPHIISTSDYPAYHSVGKSEIFVDDESGSTRAKHPSELREKIQKETDNVVEWLKDNRLCMAGEK